MSDISICLGVVVIVAAVLAGAAVARATYVDYRDESADDHRR